MLQLHSLLILGVLGSSLLAATGCVTPREEANFGIQETHKGFVPARIAILPCRKWPTGSRFAALPLSNVSDLELRTLCQAFDAAVIEAFTGQPYMRGFSPSFVLNQLDEAGKETFLDRIDTLWAHKASDCESCQTAPGFYSTSLSERSSWLLWLSTLSQTIRNSDAVLVPFFMYAYERRFNDRGLLVAERGAGVSLLLIDTGTGELLWAGGRRAIVPSKRLETQKVREPIEFPPWGDVLSRLFIEDLWREFPGRQVF